MIHLVLWGLFPVLSISSAHAAWARIPVAELKHGFSSVDFANLGGTRTLIVSSHLGALETFQWRRNGWLRSRHILPFEAWVMAVLPGSARASDRLLLGAGNRRELLMLAPARAGWHSVEIELPGEGTTAVSASLSRIDGAPCIVVARKFPGRRTSAITRDIRIGLYECREAGKTWACKEILRQASSPFILNPPWKLSTDVILGEDSVLVQSSGAWRALGERQSLWGIVAPSRNRELVVYSSDTEYVFNADFSRVERRAVPPVSTTMWSVAVGDLHGDGKERVYRSGINSHLYEFSLDRGSWSVVDLGVGRARPAFMAAGDVRGGGRDRLYVIEQENNSEFVPATLLELSFYSRVSTAAVFNFEYHDPTATPERKRSLETVLGNAFRSELAGFGHIAVVDEESLDRAIAERQLQSTFCRDEACLRAVGHTAAAQTSITGRVQRTAQGFIVSVRVLDNLTGLLTFRRIRRGIPEERVLENVKTLAWEIGRVWPNR